MILIDLSQPASGAVTLAAAKTFLRVDHPDEDDLIADLIQTAALQIESRCGVSLITRRQRLMQTTDGTGVYLNRFPVKSVELVYLNGASVDFEANVRARPVHVIFEGAGDVGVNFTAGFGETPEDIPVPLRQAVLLLLAHLYEYRGVDEAVPPPLMMIDALIQPYRGVRL